MSHKSLKSHGPWLFGCLLSKRIRDLKAVLYFEWHYTAELVFFVCVFSSFGEIWSPRNALKLICCSLCSRSLSGVRLIC